MRRRILVDFFKNGSIIIFKEVMNNSLTGALRTENNEGVANAGSWTLDENLAYTIFIDINKKSMTSKKKMRYAILYADKWSFTTSCPPLLAPELPPSAGATTRSSSTNTNTWVKSGRSSETKSLFLSTRPNSRTGSTEWSLLKETGSLLRSRWRSQSPRSMWMRLSMMTMSRRNRWASQCFTMFLCSRWCSGTVWGAPWRWWGT